MSKVQVMDHPLIQHKIGVIGEKMSERMNFVQLLVKLRCSCAMKRQEI